MLYAGFDAEEAEGPEAEQAKIRAGYGHEVWDGEDESDEEGWTKEILLSGRSRTSWGYSDIRGRVRAWDGLVMMSIAYSVSVGLERAAMQAELMVANTCDGAVALERLSAHRRVPCRPVEGYFHSRAFER